MTEYRDKLVERLIEHMERMQVRMRSRAPTAWSDRGSNDAPGPNA